VEVKVKFAMDRFMASQDNFREKTIDSIDDLTVEFLNYRSTCQSMEREVENLVVKMEISETIIDEKLEGIHEKNAEEFGKIQEKAEIKAKTCKQTKVNNVKFVKPPFG
jgi:hypothetical protein